MTTSTMDCENPKVYNCSMMDCDSRMWALNAHTKHKNDSMNVNVSSMGTNRLLSNKMHKSTIDDDNQFISWQPQLMATSSWQSIIASFW